MALRGQGTLQRLIGQPIFEGKKRAKRQREEDEENADQPQQAVQQGISGALKLTYPGCAFL